MNNLIFIVLDGLNARVAQEHLGFLEHLVEKGEMAAYTVKSEMPAQSRPLYEVLQTGVPIYEHGITSNAVVRESKEVSVFDLAKESGLVTGAAAYNWVSELYNERPFDPHAHRIQLHSGKRIEHGIFYYEDHYPDTHLVDDANFLINQMATDYTLIHTMNIDDAGHKFGSLSKEYVQAAVKVESHLSQYIYQWMHQGYQIVVTADHGMTEYHLHNGVSDDNRLVPLYIYSDKVIPGNYKDDTYVPQLEIAPMNCHLLGIPTSDKMISVEHIAFEKGN